MSTAAAAAPREERPPGAPPRRIAPPDRTRGGVTLAVIVSSQLMLVLDTTIVNVALPDIQRALRFSPTDLAWVLNAYTLAFGGLLLLGGRAGDILGRLRVFQAGVLLFAAASLAGGLGTESWMLIACRVGQGVGAACASPNALALLTANFPEGPRRTKALAAWAAANGVGGSIGLILGGMLTTWVSWRWVMFINVPIAIGVAALAPRFVRGPTRSPGRFDVTGALTATVGLAALTYGFIRASSDGWDDIWTLAAFGLAVVVLTLFVAHEARTEQPVVPLRLVAEPARARSYFLLLLLLGSMFSMFFFTTQFLQEVLGFSALRAGLAFLPLSVGLLVSAQRTSTLLPRLGAKLLMLAGAALCGGGMGWLTQLSENTSYATGILGPMLLFGLGVGMLIVPLNISVVAGVDPKGAGAASSMMVVTQQVGAALGLAVLVTVYGAASRDAARNPPAGLDPRELHHHILAGGMAGAFTVATGFVAAVFLTVLLTWRNHQGQPSTEIQPSEASPSQAPGPAAADD
ncbi:MULTISPECIES: MFS transporter [Pseudofrankia]|uniref:MFS transporter n=1 Tax=Pseudofrankia TaxID=2994363 RepID=UPI000234BA62|nr:MULTISPECIES: MFS transporter [Pseudofrankia]OHV31341.1 MFS transporter [Pseudofrankia sp. EUN1h]